MGWGIADGDTVNSAYLKDLIEAALGDGTPAQGANEIVFYASDDSKWKARNGITGKIDAHGTDAATVIQAALDGLTSGRTWKEKVVLTGDFGNVYDLDIPNYTILEGVNAKLTLPIDQSYIINSSAARSNIEVRGITFVATRSGRTAESIAIRFADGTDIKIADNYFSEFRYTSGVPSCIRGAYTGLTAFNNIFTGTYAASDNQYHIYLSSGTSDARILANRFYTPNDGNAIYTYDSSDVKIGLNEIVGGGDAEGNVEGIDVEKGTHFTIGDNVFKNLNIDGILIGTSDGQSRSITIYGNDFNHCGRDAAAGRSAISIANRATNVNKAITISGNDFYDCKNALYGGASGVAQSYECSFLNNNIYDCIYPANLYGTTNAGWKVRWLNNEIVNCTNPFYFETLNGCTLISPVVRVNSIFDDSDANATLSNIGDHMSISFADNQAVTTRFNVTVPLDYQEMIRARLAVVSPCGGGTTLRWTVATDWGAGDEAYNNGSDGVSSTDTTLVANEIELLSLTSAFTGIVAGDHVGVAFQREGNHANDTLGDVLHILQFWMQYI